MSYKQPIQMAVLLLLFTLFQSCNTRNDSKESDSQQQNYIENDSRQTVEDGKHSSSSDNSDVDKTKDSATVGPVAPKSPVKGGRTE